MRQRDYTTAAAVVAACIVGAVLLVLAKLAHGAPCTDGDNGESVCEIQAARDANLRNEINFFLVWENNASNAPGTLEDIPTTCKLCTGGTTDPNRPDRCEVNGDCPGAGTCSIPCFMLTDVDPDADELDPRFIYGDVSRPLTQVVQGTGGAAVAGAPHTTNRFTGWNLTNLGSGIVEHGLPDDVTRLGGTLEIAEMPPEVCNRAASCTISGAWNMTGGPLVNSVALVSGYPASFSAGSTDLATTGRWYFPLTAALNFASQSTTGHGSLAVKGCNPVDMVTRIRETTDGQLAAPPSGGTVTFGLRIAGSDTSTLCTQTSSDTGEKRCTGVAGASYTSNQAVFAWVECSGTCGAGSWADAAATKLPSVDLDCR